MAACRSIAFVALLAAAPVLAAPLGEPALPAGVDIRQESGDLTIGAKTWTVVRYTWRDSAGDPRSVALVPAGATTGFAVQMTYQVADGAKRTVYVNTEDTPDGGFGYFVSHELYRSFSNGANSPIAWLHAEDDSPLGRYLASTGTASSVGAAQAAHEFRLAYPRWGTVAAYPNPDGVTVPAALDQHQRFLLPVVIRWTFLAGRDWPLWSVAVDLRGTEDRIANDVRGPYGVMYFNEGVGPAITAVRWGDKFLFSADAGGAEFGATAAPPDGIAWAWNTLNAGRRYNVLSSGSYEFGLVDTVPFAASKYGDGFANARGGVKMPGQACNYGMLAMPCGWEWAYQSFQDDAGPPARPKLAWGASPFLGSSLTTVYVSATQTETIVPQGIVSYGVHVVLGRAGPGAPLTLARAAAPLEAAPALSVSVTPAAGGTVSYSVLGDAGGPYADAGRVLAPWASVKLVAAPGAGRAFLGWGGACAGVAGPECVIAMDLSLAVTARFSGGATRGDANGDGKADLFWRSASPGTGLSWWTMNGSASTAANYHDVDPAWQIADVGDLDGDGKADLVWRRASDGATYLWLLDGFSFKGFADLGILDPATWSLAGIADLDGNGKDDVVWRASDGTVYGWLMNGGTIASQGVIVSPGAQWIVAAIADMDGNGRADIVFRNVNDGGVFIYFMNGLALASGTFVGIVDPAAWTIAGAADFSGDGKADILWRHTSGDTWVWLMNGGAFVSAGGIGNPGVAWSVRAIGDYDGDGKVDLVWRHTDGTTYLWKMNGAAVSAFQPLPSPGGTWQVVAP